MISPPRLYNKVKYEGLRRSAQPLGKLLLQGCVNKGWKGPRKVPAALVVLVVVSRRYGLNLLVSDAQPRCCLLYLCTRL